MISRTIAFLLVIAAAALNSPAQQPSLLHDVTVVDVRAGKSVPHQDVLIANGRIQAVQPAAKPPSGAVILHTGGFVIPGLWDMHVHLAGVAADPKWSGDLLLPELLKYGITSARDMGGDLDALKRWRAEISRGDRVGPTLYFAGPMLSSQESKTPDTRTVRTADDARKAVDDLQAQGVDFIKILHIPRVAYFALAEEAKQKHISFVGHLPYGVSVQEAAAAGQKTIEHINWSVLALDCSAHPKEMREKLFATFQSQEKGGYERVLDEAAANFDEKNCASVADAITEHSAWSVPTLVSEETAMKVLDQPRDQGLLKQLPEKLQAEWSPEKLKAENPPEHVEWLQRQWKNDLRIATFLHDHGVHMLAGSDSLDVMTFPGPTLHRELQLLVQMGMPPSEALRAATLDSAHLMGKDAESGSVETGKVADLVILTDDPLRDIANTRKIDQVIVRGSVFGTFAH